MGFDIECIIDIQTYPGEYFCPVCRTLVYPNEAFQSQCRHLYCKPCLDYISNGSKACPYDEFLVTASDSKPLIDSDKALAENIGKVKVHCLYFRSGCTWEGPLSNCTAHCSVCTFGNSPVICNRCGVQIVHRQVHDHAQSCLGAQHEGQQAAGGVSNISKPGTISSTTELNQAAAQSGAPLSQAQNSQNATAFPGQNLNVQASAAAQAPAVASAAVPVPEQWYQQQYQQYYQQYGSYDPYQQANQQYYSLQPQSVQQYQQPPGQLQGQYQSNVYTQPQQQPYPVPQAPQQSHIPQAQGQVQIPPQAQPNVVPAQGQQAQSFAPPFLNYQANLQQQTHLPVQPQTQMPPQALPPPPPPPQTQPTNPQQLYAQTVGSQPPAQHLQYQPPVVQMHHPQPSQASMQQPQLQSQTQAQVLPQPPQSSSQLHGHIQPQQQPYLSQSQPSVFPQANQPTPATLAHGPQQPVSSVSGHQSYLNPLPPPKMHSGAPQQHPMPPQNASGFQHPVALHGQIPQQHAQMRPPSHGSVLQQHPPTLLAPQNQQFPSHVPQLANPQHRPGMLPAQQPLPQNYAQQQPHMFPTPQNLLHHPVHLIQQQSMQTQLHSSGPPVQQSQNFVGKPPMTNQGIHSQDHSFQPNQFGAPTQPGPAQFTSSQASVNQNYAKSTVLEPNATVRDARPPSKMLVEKVGDPINEEKMVVGKTGAAVKNTDNDACVNKSIKQNQNHVHAAVEQASDQKSLEDAAGEADLHKEGGVSASLKHMDLESQKSTLTNAVATGAFSTNLNEQSHTALPAACVEGDVLPLQTHVSQQQRPPAQVQGHPPTLLGPQGPGISPHPGKPFNTTDERVPAPRPFDRAAVHGPIHDPAANFGPAMGQNSRNYLDHPSGVHGNVGVFVPGHEFDQHRTNNFPHKSPHGNYRGSPHGFGGRSSFPLGTSGFDDVKFREGHRFGEGSESFNHPPDPAGIPFHDGRIPSMSGPMQRGDLDVPRNPRFGEHMAPGQHQNPVGNTDFFRPDGPVNQMRGKFSGSGFFPGHVQINDPAGPGAFSGRGQAGEFGGPGNFPRPNFSRLGEPPLMNYSLPGFHSGGNFIAGMDSFDHSRKRNPVSGGWCRICEIDCESLEGLDLHSQTLEHQITSMNIVKRIKLQNRRHQRNSAGHMMNEGEGRSRKTSLVGRRSNP